VGIVLQSTGVDPFLTVRETVALFAGYYPSPLDVDEVIDVVGLGEKRASRVNQLSGGQQRRLDVAIALAGDPELLFLDEPTTGFDPGARRGAWDVVRNLAAMGKTVFLTTHYMDEAQALATRVAVIARGRIVAEGPPSTLGDRHLGDTVIRFRLPAGAGDAPASVGSPVRTPDGGIELLVADPVRALHELTAWALERGVGLQGLEVARPTLEDVYLDLTRGEAGSE
ncbi:MAG: ABC transporter ATP-binding protein, partial [Actinomycetota bacterium]